MRSSETLNTKFWYLKAQVLCSTSEGNKLDKEGDMSGLYLDMNKLVESQKRLQTGGNGISQYGKSQDLSVMTCS